MRTFEIYVEEEKILDGVENLLEFRDSYLKTGGVIPEEWPVKIIFTEDLIYDILITESFLVDSLNSFELSVVVDELSNFIFSQIENNLNEFLGIPSRELN